MVVVCAGLAIALFATKKAADDQRVTATSTILEFSNQLVTANISLNDLRQVNLILTNDLATTRETSATLSNSLTETTVALTETKLSLGNAQAQITNLNARIDDLEDQNKNLDARAGALTNNIAAMDAQIAAIQQQLAASQTNNAYLTSELQRQMAEKAELQRKFNDLDEVRTQVKKLREEQFVARRLQWMREGSNPGSSTKGAQLLMQHTAGTPAPAKPSQYDLNVEVGSDGSYKVIPPSTNAPAH